MEYDIFKAGVRPGGLTSHDEVKMLVCYLVSKLPEPIRFDQLHEALADEHLVNYFELVQAVEELVHTGHLTAGGGAGAEQYAATDLGRKAGTEFEIALPLSVREKSLASVDQLLRRQKREAEVSIQVRPSGGGFLMDLAIPQAGGDLVSFALFLPTQEECDLVRRRFLNDPVFIYKGVMALLTGDREVLGKIFPPQEDLYR